MNLTLKRINKTQESTIGELYLDGIFECYTLEDTDRNLSSLMSVEEIKNTKIYGNTAIPRGKYTLSVQQSTSNGKKYYYLQNIKGYSGVRIEWGNTQVDTLGCILLGTTYSTNKVNNSILAYNTLIKKLNLSKAPHSITIIDQNNVSKNFWYILFGAIVLITFIFRFKISTFFKTVFKR